VFLLSLKPERDQSFEVLFEELFHLLETKETVNKLALQRTYEDFITSCNDIINN
jgi:mannitol/fructose-specific phosphotransferase system IIA component (Ntr-type)